MIHLTKLRHKFCQQDFSNELIRDIPGALNISDVIVFCKTQAEHDAAFQAVFRKSAVVNLTLNKKKCDFNKKSITFFGFVISGQGISPDPKKVEAIKNAKPPTMSSGVNGHILYQVHPELQ